VAEEAGKQYTNSSSHNTSSNISSNSISGTSRYSLEELREGPLDDSAQVLQLQVCFQGTDDEKQGYMYDR
jgi:hypothetical protein